MTERLLLTYINEECAGQPAWGNAKPSREQAAWKGKHLDQAEYFLKDGSKNRIVGRPCDARSTKNPGLGLGCPSAVTHTLCDLVQVPLSSQP